MVRIVILIYRRNNAGVSKVLSYDSNIMMNQNFSGNNSKPKTLVKADSAYISREEDNSIKQDKSPIDSDESPINPDKRYTMSYFKKNDESAIKNMPLRISEKNHEVSFIDQSDSDYSERR